MAEHNVSSHERGADQSALVYPVLSRRSGGLSVGVNLFPDRKRRSFDCPYCEVKPFSGSARFSKERLAAELDEFFAREYRASWAPRPVRDLCVSGNGEATLSPDLGAALEACATARRAHADIAGSASIILITNSTGFLDGEVSRLLRSYSRSESLKIWAKLDGGTQELFAAMSRSSYDIDEIAGALLAFAKEAPVTVQTMVCDLDGLIPGQSEAAAYASRLSSMLDAGVKIEAVQIYTLARPPADGRVHALPDEAVIRFADCVSRALGGRAPVLGFGERGIGPLFRS